MPSTRIVGVEQLALLRDNEPWIALDREADKIDMPDEEYRRYGRAQNPLRIPSKYYRDWYNSARRSIRRCSR